MKHIVTVRAFLAMTCCTLAPVLVGGTAAGAATVPAEPGQNPFTRVEIGTVQAPRTIGVNNQLTGALVATVNNDLQVRRFNSRSWNGIGGDFPAHLRKSELGDVTLAFRRKTSDNFAYLSWVEKGENGSRAVVGRAKVVQYSGATSFREFETIWEQEEWQSGETTPPRLAANSDGSQVFVALGDQGDPDAAQDLETTRGKILRLTSDGAPVEGNPFADRGETAAQIWSYGHHNPTGLTVAPDGNLWSTEQGPDDGELNLILEGRNYDAPNNDGQDTPGAGAEAPKLSWDSSVSPSGLMVYTGDAWPQWKGDAFIGSLEDNSLIRVDLDGTTATEAERWNMGAPVRDVEQATRGSSLLILEDTEPNGETGRLVQLKPGE